MPISRPVSPAVEAKTTTIKMTATPLIPKAAMRAVLRLPAPSSRIISRISFCHRRILSAACSLRSLEGRGASSPSRSTCPSGVFFHDLSTSWQALVISAIKTVCNPDSIACSTRCVAGGRPEKNAPTRSLTRPIAPSMPRRSSPAPTKSCQRDKISPRSNEPSLSAALIRSWACANLSLVSRRKSSSCAS